MQHSVKATTSSTIGTLIEWYDFYIYGLCATLIFPKIFFPEINPAIAVIIGFASYSIAFIFRPLGALLFGYLGDKYGRVKVLAWSLFLMGGSTVAIGLLPTYAQVGMLAPILLLFLRIVQGFAVGGEWGSASTMTFESTPPHKRGLAGGMIQMTVPLALVISTGVFGLVVANFGEQELLDYAWRIPFLLSFIMLFIGGYIRFFLPEAKEFTLSKKVKNPLLAIYQEHKQMITHVALARLFQNVMFNTISLFFITYLTTKLHYPRIQAIDALMIGAGVSVVFILIWASLSDVVRRRNIMLFGIIGTIISLSHIFGGLQSGDFQTIALVFVGAFFFHDAMYGVQASIIPEQFPTEIRLSATNLSYNIGAAIAGLASMLIPIILEYRNNIWDVAIFLSFIGAISAYNCYKLK